MPSKKKSKRKAEDELLPSATTPGGSTEIHMAGLSAEKKKKQEKLTMEQVEKNFQPHDYQKQGYKLFEGMSGRAI